MSALVLAPALLLQKPGKKSKAEEHKRILERRLAQWKDGHFEELFREGVAIQKPLKYRSPSKELCESRFVDLMRNGQTTEATGWLDSSRHSCGVKECTDEVLQDLEAKHPPAALTNSKHVDVASTATCEPVTYQSITGESIYKCGLRIRGSGGPSGFDSSGLSRILCSRKYKKSSAGLCDALSLVARKLATTEVHGDFLAIFRASRLIPLEKPDGGTRPIGIGEVFRRVITKAIIFSQRGAVKEAAGSVQLAAGQAGGCEAAIHALFDRFEEDDCEGALLLDASNAFNSLNRGLALHSVQRLCPILAQFMRNMYGTPSPLYVGSHVLMSDEGTTQGCPSAMAMYSIGILPLISKSDLEDVLQAWYADDGNGAGSISGLFDWFQSVVTHGPAFGYHINPNKCTLIVKEQHLEKAEEIFADTGVMITTAGARHLGAAIGTEAFRKEFVTAKVELWKECLLNLVSIAKTHPHLAYSNYIRSFKMKWVYFQRTVPNISEMFQPLEDVLRHQLIPLLVGKHVSDLERRILALPIRMGGMALENPVVTANLEYNDSRFTTEPLVSLILGGESRPSSVADAESQCREKKKSCEEATQTRNEAELNNILAEADIRTRRALELCAESGASSWLSARPLERLGHELNQREFIDAIRLRYSFHFPDLDGKCGCGQDNNSDHALICKVGGFDIWRHDHLRDTMADILRYAGLKPVNTEQLLLSCEGFDGFHATANTADDARMDIVCRGLWSDMEAAYLDVRVFHPNAPSYVKEPIANLHKRHQNQKKLAYMRRVIRVEQGTFTPLVFATSGGFAPEVGKVLQRAAEKICARRKEGYAETMTFIKQKLRFSLLRSTLVALRGTKRRTAFARLEETDFRDV